MAEMWVLWLLKPKTQKEAKPSPHPPQKKKGEALGGRTPPHNKTQIEPNCS